MKKFKILILLFVLPFSLSAQYYTEYNIKGDEAMMRKDFRNARMWYSEGVAACDIYSIGKLQDIWLENESMRPSMQSLMNRCINCLREKANANDTIAISQLIIYYREGIGGAQNELLAQEWSEKLDLSRIPSETVYPFRPVTIKKPRERMKFFAAYAYSTEMPYGITLGGIQDKMGWYIRGKSNFSFKDHTYECYLENGEAAIKEPFEKGKRYRSDEDKSNTKNSYSATVGFIYKFAPLFAASIGIGYGERTLLSPFIVEKYETHEFEKNILCKNLDASYKGVVVEIDAMIPYKSFFFSIGCHTMNFDYVDLNAGIGVFF